MQEDVVVAEATSPADVVDTHLTLHVVVERWDLIVRYVLTMHY